MRRLAWLLVCGALPALAARPVARPHQGPFDGVEVVGAAAGVVARFEASVTRADAQQTIEQVVQKLGLNQKLTVGFIKSPAGNLASLTIRGLAHFTYRGLLELARVLSTRPGVVEAFAHLFPGPRDSELEAEGWSRYSRGEVLEGRRVAWRDDPAYVRWVREQASDSAWRLQRWPGYPLAELARRLGLPGRDCLEAPSGLLTLATEAWPTDAGDNLSRVSLYLPAGMAVEIQLMADREQVSTSKLVASALRRARDEKHLGASPEAGAQASSDDGQPGAGRMAQRTLVLWLPEGELSPAEDAANADASSLSQVVQKAWRRAHPATASSKPATVPSTSDAGD